VAQADFAEAIERVVAGLEEKPRLNDKEKRLSPTTKSVIWLSGNAGEWSGREDFYRATRDGSLGTPYNRRLKTASNG